jgi:hypothetical protein
MEPTPDTSTYMFAGYIIAFLVMGIYIFSLYIRTKNLKAELEVLETVTQK